METEQKHPLDPDVYQRNELILDDTHNEDLTVLRFMNWNVLADKYTSSFSSVPACYFKKSYRYNLMVLEIIANAIDIKGSLSLPHIICLQEVNMGERLLETINKAKVDGLQDFDYKWDYILDTHRKRFGNFILYDSTKYKLVATKKDFFRGLFGDNLMDR